MEAANTNMTEAELEARANQVLQLALPWLDPKSIRHQLSFSFKLGHKTVPIDGSKTSRRQGRVDILIERGQERVAILELKRPDKALNQADVDQGLSYARVLHPRPPLVIVSNGHDTRTFAAHDGRELGEGGPDEAALIELNKAALKIAESDVHNAITSLMGPDSNVWMSAVRAASQETLDSLSGDFGDCQATFVNGFHFPRNATTSVIEALRGKHRVVAVEGAPLIGKTHVLGELATATCDNDDMAVLFVEASGSAAVGIVDEIARILSSTLGWQIAVADVRQWLAKLGNATGPQLVIAIDGLGLEHNVVRRELEALTAHSYGQRLKFVIEADTAVVDRLWSGETRRKATVLARRGKRICLEALDDEEFSRACQVMYKNGGQFMHGAARAEEYRQPWLLRSLLATAFDDPERPEEAIALLPPLLSTGLFNHANQQFVHDTLIEQAATFACAVLDDYQRHDRSPDLQLRAMHSFFLRKNVLRKHASGEELEAMSLSGLVGSTLSSSNRALMFGRIPELIATELAREIAAELNERLNDEDSDEGDTARWFVRVVSVLPMGDVIGAWALISCADLCSGLPIPFINRLLECRPTSRPLNAGTKAVMWVPEIGQIDMTVNEDGTAVFRSPGPSQPLSRIEIPSDELGVTYDNLDAWLVLSHVASVPIGAFSADEDGVFGLFDAALLGLVGTSSIPLRRVPIDLEKSGMHLHDAPGGASLVCSNEGIIEPITWSIFRFLDRHGDNAENWLDDVLKQRSAPLLSRLSIALRQLAKIDSDSATGRWARDRLESTVLPALQDVMRG